MTDRTRNDADVRDNLTMWRAVEQTEADLAARGPKAVLHDAVQGVLRAARAYRRGDGDEEAIMLAVHRVAFVAAFIDVGGDDEPPSAPPPCATP